MISKKTSTRNILGKSVAAAVVASAAGLSGVAQSAPLMELFYSQNAGFLAPSFEIDALELKDTFAPTGPDAPAGTSTGFSWQGGNAPAESSISIASFDDSTAPDMDLDGDPLKFSDPAFTIMDATPESWNAGDWWVIDTLTQSNEVLTPIEDSVDGFGDPTWIVDTLANLRIFADELQTELLFFDENSLTTIDFWESRNRTNAETCPGLNPLGTGCDDVFSILETDLDPIFFDLADEFGTLYRYEIDFNLLPGASTEGGVPLATKSVVIPIDGELSVFTPETDPGTSSIHVVASWSVSEVSLPLPSGIALFGAGLMALGGFARRKVAGKA